MKGGPNAPSKDWSEHDEPPLTERQIRHLFFTELETQVRTLSEGLLALEVNSHDRAMLVSLMRAAHSIKGAARLLGVQQIVQIAHALEGSFTCIEKVPGALDSAYMEFMLAAVDLLAALVNVGSDEMSSWLEVNQIRLKEVATGLCYMAGGTAEDTAVPAHSSSEAKQAPILVREERVLRVNAGYLTGLMGLAGELLVESRWLDPFSDALLQLKRNHHELTSIVELFCGAVDEHCLREEAAEQLLLLQQKTHACRHSLTTHLERLELFTRRHASLSDRFYREIITSRMCSFGEGIEGLARMVRDLAKQLHKQARLEVVGRSTTIDRDILDKLKAPLNQLLRNAVDHGLETVDERVAKGKKPEGTIRLEACHRGGALCITVSDDGRGINLEQVKQQIVLKKLIEADMASQLTEQEALDFLFLPGFSTANKITELSGRGFGLDIVQTMAQEVGGQVRVSNSPNQGAAFHLKLPLTLSVLRALLVEIVGEPYAFPLAHIGRAMTVNRSQIRVIQDREYLNIEGQNIRLVQADQLFGLSNASKPTQELCVVVLSENMIHYAVVVDRFIGEKELVVQDLDARLGKVPAISCGAFMEDGSPTLVIDVGDMARSIDKLFSVGPLGQISSAGVKCESKRQRKKVLIVDDSVTVRELASRLLEHQGYEVEVAVNGVDGWNSVRIGGYDLVITDVDMPRMNGIELVRCVKGDQRLKALPVMIVSCKERHNDHLLGAEAGAAVYLEKSSFHDGRFLEAVKKMLGEA